MKLEIVLNEEKAKEHHYNIHKGYAKIEDCMGYITGVWEKKKKNHKL